MITEHDVELTVDQLAALANECRELLKREEYHPPDRPDYYDYHADVYKGAAVVKTFCVSCGPEYPNGLFAVPINSLGVS